MVIKEDDVIVFKNLEIELIGDLEIELKGVWENDLYLCLLYYYWLWLKVIWVFDVSWMDKEYGCLYFMG